MSRGIDEKDLDPETRNQVRARAGGLAPEKLGPNSPLLAARGAQAARKRQRVGKSLEQELEFVHQLYELQKRARIRKLHVAMQVVGHDAGMRAVYRPAKGGAPVDYAGTAKIAGKVRPIAFDAKSARDRSSYQQEPEQLHQLQELLDRQRFGELAFLLVVDLTFGGHGVGYIIDTPAQLAALQRGESIALREAVALGPGSGKITKGDLRRTSFLVPHFLIPAMSRQDEPRIDYLTMLETLLTEGK